jgi:hypothetical protein
VIHRHGGGQGEDPLQYAGGDAPDGVPAVLFEVELALESVVHRFGDLVQGLEELGPGPGRLTLAGLAQQPR